MTKYNRDNRFYKGMCEQVGEDFSEWLERKYWDEELNTRQIAGIVYGKTKNGPNIAGWMKKLDVPVRSRSKAIELQWKDNPKRREEQSKQMVNIWDNDTDNSLRNEIIETMQTDEYKEKQRISKTGEGNGMYGKIGELHPNYNHEMTDEERIVGRRYTAYTDWRKDVFERDNYTCQICEHKKGGNLVAHHINSYHWDISNRTEIDNGITLCESCHKEFHSMYGYKDNDLFQFSQFEQMK